MKLISIEPTPSPNSMKLNIDETLPQGIRYTYRSKEPGQAPEPLASLLRIEGVRGLFRTADFIALDRMPSADWQRILAAARSVLQAPESAVAGATAETGTGFGEAHVLVQMFRGIPMQVRVRIGDQEARAALPEQFSRAVSEAAGSTMIRERKLEEWGIRYGEPDEVLAEVVAELAATYTEERLRELITAAQALSDSSDAATAELAVRSARPEPLTAGQLAEKLAHEDWRERYAALERTAASPEILPLLATAITDDNASVRRLAVVYLGDLRSAEAMPLLFQALRDPSASVRRTAGDTLSDIGDPAAIEPMIAALKDKNKLVRWRAARFLYEAGDERAIPALKESMQDPEFEISLQATIALERIERGEEAAGSVWQQMTAMREDKQ